MGKLETNREILRVLAILVERNPYLRFHQLLAFADIVRGGNDYFYKESEQTLKELEDKFIL